MLIIEINRKCDSIDEFECSNCGIILSEYQQIEIDEDDGERYFYDYRPKYCPNCGRKIVDWCGLNENKTRIYRYFRPNGRIILQFW